MKSFLLFLFFALFVPASLFAQPVIDFETVGNNWAWNIFSQGTGGSFDIVANPNPGGLNTSDSCAMLVIGADGDPWAGVYCTDFPDMTIDASNCIVKILVYKDVTSRFNLKLEPPNVDNFDSNTVINQWEELTFDYSSYIGTTGITLTLIPDMEQGSRTHASVNYMDYIRFTPQISGVVDLGGSNPVNFELAQNYPNPFNPTTTINIGLPVRADVSLDVYNIVGEKVLRLYSGELEAGNYNYIFDASKLTSGIYIYVLNAVGEDGKNSTLSRKMTLLK
jgi:hypothetical protein